MVRMIVDGKPTDVPDEYALGWAMSNMVSSYEIVGGVHWALYFGMPASSSTRFISLLDKACESLSENVPTVDEPTLRRVAERLAPALSVFVEAAKSTLRWQKANVSSATRKKHNRESRETGPQEPEWFRTGEGRGQFENLSSSYGDYLDALDPTLDELMDLVDPFDPDNYAEHLKRTRERILFARDVVTSGYVEAYRRAAGLQGE